MSLSISIFKKGVIFSLFATLISILIWVSFHKKGQELPKSYQFTQAEIEFLRGFTLSQLKPVPESVSNKVADSDAAAELGHKLFFDTGMSRYNHISCATCHQPQRYFTDGIPTAVGLGPTKRNTPTIVGAAFSHWQFWDGRKDSLWAQALGPIEDNHEHGGDRVKVARLIQSHYQSAYTDVFGDLPDFRDTSRFPTPASPVGTEEAIQNWNAMQAQDQEAVNQVFANVGKALEAYQRKLRPGPSKFDDFVDAIAQKDPKRALDTYSEDEVLGMRLFMGRANCSSCHNGPLFTNFEFHNVGVPEVDQTAVDLGRFTGVKQLATDEFNCLSPWSDASEAECLEIRFLKTGGKELVGAFKTPSLRNVALTAPYMQSGQLEKLDDVIAHYDKPKPPFFDPKQHPDRPHFDILPLRLRDYEKRQLKAFLESLSGGIDAEARWVEAPAPMTAQAK